MDKEKCVLCRQTATEVVAQMRVCSKHKKLFDTDWDAFYRKFRAKYPYMTDMNGPASGYGG